MLTRGVQAGIAAQGKKQAVLQVHRVRCARFSSRAARLSARKRPDNYSELSNEEIWAQDGAQGSQAQREKDASDRFRRMEVIKGLLGGVVSLGALFGGFFVYLKYPAIRDWWYYDPGLKEVPAAGQGKQKEVLELPANMNPNDSSVPGLYVCGDNSSLVADPSSKVKQVKHPLRHAWFDGVELRSVWLGEQSALAIDQHGDLIQWGRGFDGTGIPQYTVKGQDLVRGSVSNGMVYCVNRRNEVVYLPERDADRRQFQGDQYRDWALRTRHRPYRKLDLSSLRKNEHVVQFETGASHFLLLTDAGRVFSGATGVSKAATKDSRESREARESRGQFGLLEHSNLDAAPEPNVLHEVKLLNSAIERDAKGKIVKVEPRFIKQIACGDHHSLALDSIGEVYSFGQNTLGQLGHKVSYETEYIAYPKRVDFGKHLGSGQFPQAVEIQAGGDTSFVSIRPVEMYNLIKKNSAGNQESFVVGFGSNLKGQIGNGHFIQAEFDSTRLKNLSELRDYDEELRDTKKIPIEEWSSGREHTFIKLANRDVLYWGSNDYCQLGNGKKSRICKPVAAPALLEPFFTPDLVKSPRFVNRLQLDVNQHVVAGAKNTAIYYSRA